MRLFYQKSIYLSISIYAFRGHEAALSRPISRQSPEAMPALAALERSSTVKHRLLSLYDTWFCGFSSRGDTYIEEGMPQKTGRKKLLMMRNGTPPDM